MIDSGKPKRHLALLGETGLQTVTTLSPTARAAAWIGDERGNVRVISRALFIAFSKKRFAWFVFDLHKTLLSAVNQGVLSFPTFGYSRQRISMTSVQIVPSSYAVTSGPPDRPYYSATIEVGFYKRPIDPGEPAWDNRIQDRAEWYIFRGPRIVQDTAFRD